jgi:hypothetical protein
MNTADRPMTAGTAHGVCFARRSSMGIAHLGGQEARKTLAVFSRSHTHSTRWRTHYCPSVSNRGTNIEGKAPACRHRGTHPAATKGSNL